MSPDRLGEIWVYLSTSPLLHLTLTVVAYLVGDFLYRRSGRQPLLHPVLLAIVMLVTLLTASRTTYPTYFEGAQFVHFLLGPATVALAVPLYLNFGKLRRLWLPLMIGLLVGSSTAALSSVGIALLLGASPQTVLALAPKSVTAPVAMAISEHLGGPPSLTAILVVSVRGFTMGVTSHGIGTARAFQESEEAGAFSGLAMGLSALLSSFLVPLLLIALGIGG